MKFAVRRGDGSWYVFVRPDGTNAYVDWRKDKEHATKWDKHEDARAVAPQLQTTMFEVGSYED